MSRSGAGIRGSQRLDCADIPVYFSEPLAILCGDVGGASRVYVVAVPHRRPEKNAPTLSR